MMRNFRRFSLGEVETVFHWRIYRLGVDEVVLLSQFFDLATLGEGGSAVCPRHAYLQDVGDGSQLLDLIEVGESLVEGLVPGLVVGRHDVVVDVSADENNELLGVDEVEARVDC